MKLALTKNALTGLLFLVLGVGTFVAARNYGLGNMRSPGPGFFPMIVGGILALLGVGLLVEASMRDTDAAERVKSWQLMPALCILGSVVAFALLMRAGQLFLAIVALVLLSSLSRGRLSLAQLLEVGAMAIVLTVVSAAVFIYGLGMPLSLW